MFYFFSAISSMQAVTNVDGPLYSNSHKKETVVFIIKGTCDSVQTR